jgi:hypothetical protein
LLAQTLQAGPDRLANRIRGSGHGLHLVNR